jgi:hypothetical protein
MPGIDAVANVIVLTAAGIGAIVAFACAVQLMRHRDGDDRDGRLT